MISISVASSFAVYCLVMLVHVQDGLASYGDMCTVGEITNCTGPGLMCSQTGICECIRGYLKNDTGPACRKPGNSETCIVDVGCAGSMLCEEIEGLLSCQCDDSIEYYSAQKQQCVAKPSFNQTCGPDIGCQEFYDCVGAPMTCQCNDSNVYFDSYSIKCQPVSELELSELRTQTSATTVTFTWYDIITFPGVHYEIDWNPHDGKMDYAEDEGGRVSGLHPGSQYNFSVVYVVSQYPYYPDKRYFGPYVTLQTKVLYGGLCNTDAACQDNATVCVQARDNLKRCLCNSASYNKTQTGNCSALEELSVTNIRSFSSDTSVNFTWTPSSYLSSLTYRIQWIPKGGHVDRVSGTGAHVSGLLGGTTYYFSITSVLPADGYNEERSVTSTDYIVGTDLPYAALCTLNGTDQCLNGTVCTPGTDGKYRCLCDNSTYFNYMMEKCSNLSDLKMSSYATASATEVTFYWSQEDPTSTALGEIDWTPHDGGIGYMNMEGGQLFGLRPGTQYNLTFTSVLNDYQYSPEKKYVAAVITLWTQATFGGLCNVSVTCQDSNTTCMAARNKQNRCLCGENLYNKTQSGNCSSLNDLMVSNISSSSSATTIFLTWSPRSRLSSVSYKVLWQPGDGRADSITNTGAMVTFLSPRSIYNFSIVSVLAADDYNQEKSIAAAPYLAKTDYSFLGNCTPGSGEDCQDGTACIRGTDGVFRCLCDNTTYFNEEYGKCYNMSYLQVSASASATATTVTVYWSDIDPYSVADQELEWSPHDGALGYERLEGALVSGLHSGSRYIFTVVSVIREEPYTPEKRFTGPFLSVWTKSLHGDQCNTSAVCQDNTTTCMPAMDKLNRCLCGSTQYNKTKTGNCSSLEDLLVSNISATTTATSTTFVWTATYNISLVVYNITWTPTGGRLGNISNTGAYVTGLTSGTTYNFTIVSILPATTYEASKSAPLLFSGVSTRVAKATGSSEGNLKVSLGVGLGCAVLVVAVLLAAAAVYKKRLSAPKSFQTCCGRGNVHEPEPAGGHLEDGNSKPQRTHRSYVQFGQETAPQEVATSSAEHISLENISESSQKKQDTRNPALTEKEYSDA